MSAAARWPGGAGVIMAGGRERTAVTTTQPEARTERSGLLGIYRSDIGKKYAMAISGILLLLFVFAHMVGNLHAFEGPEQVNHYGEALRDLGEPLLPRTLLLWLGLRIPVAIALAVHIHAAYSLTLMNRAARPVGYASRRDYVAANFASRTMRWTGVIVLLFVVFHLMDLTWGNANPDFVKGDVYANMVASFQRVPVAIIYVIANLALGLHLYHGTWSLFLSLGWNNRRFNHWLRYFAVAFALLITVGNVTFPIAVVTGIVS